MEVKKLELFFGLEIRLPVQGSNAGFARGTDEGVRPYTCDSRGGYPYVGVGDLRLLVRRYQSLLGFLGVRSQALLT